PLSPYCRPITLVDLFEAAPVTLVACSAPVRFVETAATKLTSQAAAETSFPRAQRLTRNSQRARCRFLRQIFHIALLMHALQVGLEVWDIRRDARGEGIVPHGRLGGRIDRKLFQRSGLGQGDLAPLPA